MGYLIDDVKLNYWEWVPRLVGKSDGGMIIHMDVYDYDKTNNRRGALIGSYEFDANDNANTVGTKVAELDVAVQAYRAAHPLGEWPTLTTREQFWMDLVTSLNGKTAITTDSATLLVAPNTVMREAPDLDEEVTAVLNECVLSDGIDTPWAPPSDPLDA